MDGWGADEKPALAGSGTLLPAVKRGHAAENPHQRGARAAGVMGWYAEGLSVTSRLQPKKMPPATTVSLKSKGKTEPALEWPVHPWP